MSYPDTLSPLWDSQVGMSPSTLPTPLNSATTPATAEEGTDQRCQSGGEWHGYLAATDFAPSSASGASQTLGKFHNDSGITSQAYPYSYPPDGSGDGLRAGDVERDNCSPLWWHSPSPSTGFYAPDASHMSPVAQSQGYVPNSMGATGSGQLPFHPGWVQPAPLYPTNDACPSFTANGTTNLSTPLLADASANQTPVWPHTLSTPLHEQNHDLSRPEEDHTHFPFVNTRAEEMAPYLMPFPQNLYTQGSNKVPDNYNYFAPLETMAMAMPPPVPPVPMSMPSGPSYSSFVGNPNFWRGSQYHTAGSSLSPRGPQPYNVTEYSPTSSGTSTPSSSSSFWSATSSQTTPATSPELVARATFPASGPVRTQRRQRDGTGGAPLSGQALSSNTESACANVSIPLPEDQITVLVAAAEKLKCAQATVTCGWDACGKKVTFDELLSHLQSEHRAGFSGVRVYCRWTGPCGAKTKEIGGSALKKHVLSKKHAGASVTCPLCDKVLARGDALRRHLRGTVGTKTKEI
ncbi:hypothetical protein MSAN_00465600 [Mycena sanguinolenta]|uniref:C2H2-type domain-containing protein n=1 Tax=Mycena sanguinolenta TaxID=230812 RepID=A0A8H7DIP9_9AGAR|nr:hypothetical protein MSAN_00465600 [Mycena sanguinolenta]